MQLQINQVYPNLYHIDQNDNLRVWYAERNGGKYRTVSGLVDGAKVTSDWRDAEAKNIGRSNETTPEAQADLEIQSVYRDRLSRKYSETADGAKKSNFLAPMLAATYDSVKHLKKKQPTDYFAYQPKLDGNRFLASEDGGHSRSGKPFMTVDHIMEKLTGVFDMYNITLDGELYNHELKSDFEKLSSLINTKKIEKLTEEDRQEIRDKVQYHVYDVILHDRPSATFRERVAFLQQLFGEFGGYFGDVIQLVYTSAVGATAELIKKVHDEEFEKGYEGVMIRDPSSIYEHKRTTSLIKVKDFMDAEFPLLEIRDGLGNWKGAAKSVTVQLPDGKTSDASVTGSMLRNRVIYENRADYEGKCEVTVVFQGYTEDGKLRFGRVKVFHDGKRDN